MNSAFSKIMGCSIQDPNFVKTLVQHRLFLKLKQLAQSKFIPERICGEVYNRIPVFRL